MKEPRSLGARIALTLAPVIALVFASMTLLVPGLGDDAVVRKLREESPLAVALNMGVFSIGVMPFVQAYFLVERAARALGLALAAFQAFGIAASLKALSFADVLPTTGVPETSVPLVSATLVGGACIAMLVADLVTRQGIANGLLLLPCVDLVIHAVGDVRGAFAKATIAPHTATRARSS